MRLTTTSNTTSNATSKATSNATTLSLGSLLLLGALVRCSSFDSGASDAATPQPPSDASPSTADGAEDAPAPTKDAGRCDSTAAFGDPVQLPGLVQANGSAAGRMTDDRLRIYFFAASPTGALRIFTAARPSLDAPFESPRVVDLQTPDAELDSHPTITRDGNTLFFQRSVDGGSGDRNILYAQSVGPGAFSPPTAIAALGNPAVVERTPFTATDGALWVTLDMQLDGGFTRRIARAEKIGQGVYGAPVVVDLRTPGGSEDGDPLLSADLLHIYFTSTRGTNEFNMFMASRTSTSAPFDEPMALTSLNTVDAEQPTSISADDCELLFNRSSAAGYHIWRATRPR